MPAPGADFGQRGKGIDLDPPGLVVGKMPVETVELAPGHELEETLHFGRGVELPRDVEVTAAPAVSGGIDDAAARREGKGLREKRRAAPDLAECNQAVEEASLGGGDNLEPVAENDVIGLRRHF